MTGRVSRLAQIFRERSFPDNNDSANRAPTRRLASLADPNSSHPTNARSGRPSPRRFPSRACSPRARCGSRTLPILPIPGRAISTGRASRNNRREPRRVVTLPAKTPSRRTTRFDSAKSCASSPPPTRRPNPRRASGGSETLRGETSRRIARRETRGVEDAFEDAEDAFEDAETPSNDATISDATTTSNDALTRDVPFKTLEVSRRKEKQKTTRLS